MENRKTVDAIYVGLLENSVSKNNKIAVADVNKYWTYSQLREMAYIAAYKMYMSGSTKGSKIMIPASGRIEYVAYYYGVHLLGAICIPYSVYLKKETLREIVERTNSSCIVQIEEYDQLFDLKINSEMEVVIDSLLEKEVDVDGIADILFTSGTTGKQKGVMLTNAGLKQAICNIASAIGFTEADAVLLPLPLHHSNALGTLRTYINYGGTIILLQGLKDISYLKIFIEQYNCSGLSCSPLMLDWIIRRFEKQCGSIFEKLRYIEIGTAPLSAISRRKIRTYFADKQIYINYGATETPRAVYMDINQVEKDDSVGRVIGDYEIRLFDDDNRPISEKYVAGKVGLKSKAMMGGYFKDQERTSDAMLDGFFLTGDIAYIDEEGFIFLRGRNKDIIIVGGEKVYPAEIESKINTIPGIRECVCFGIETKKTIGQQIFAYVTTEEGINITEHIIKKYLDSELEYYKIPSKVFIVDNMPRNEMGKIDRNGIINSWNKL